MSTVLSTIATQSGASTGPGRMASLKSANGYVVGKRCCPTTGYEEGRI
ncbi:MAG: hypothetical protein ABSG82_01905 [Sedimentisphaerales bacterium]